MEMCKRYFLWLIVLSFGVLNIPLILLQYRWSSLHASKPSPGINATVYENNNEEIKGSSKRLILFWTRFSRINNWMPTPFADLKCKINSCDVTFNHALLGKSDAVVLHWKDVKLNDLPRKQNKTKYILLNFECPRNGALLNKAFLPFLQPLIDWTASYRLNSDILVRHGSIKRRVERKGPHNNGTEVEFKNKRLVAWMVSNCYASSGRRLIVNELKSYGLEIDEYGSCPSGNKSFRNVDRAVAYRTLANRYKFYLSFENDLCRDYSTEKLYHPLHNGMVPVVYGGSDYKKLLPNNSFIDVLDFASLKDLAIYLMAVGNSENLYHKHQHWRNNYIALVYPKGVANFLCDLCEKIQNPSSVVIKRNTDLVKWWNQENDCFNAFFNNGTLNNTETFARREVIYSKT